MQALRDLSPCQKADDKLMMINHWCRYLVRIMIKIEVWTQKYIFSGFYRVRIFSLIINVSLLWIKQIHAVVVFVSLRDGDLAI